MRVALTCAILLPFFSSSLTAERMYGREAVLRHTSIGTAASCDVDPDVSDADFTLEFPAGTRYLEGSRIYEFQADGSSREIPRPGDEPPHEEDQRVAAR